MPDNTDETRRALRRAQPYCRVHGIGTQTISASTSTALLADTDDKDVWGMHSTTSNTSRINIPLDGTYLMSAEVNWSDGTSNARHFDIQVNGTASGIRWLRRIDLFQLAGNVRQQGMVETDLVAGDYVEIYVIQDTAGNLNCRLQTFCVSRVR